MKTEYVKMFAGSDHFVDVNKTIHIPKCLSNDHFVGVNNLVGGGQPTAPFRSANSAASYQPGATPQGCVHSFQQGSTARPIPATHLWCLRTARDIKQTIAGNVAEILEA